MKPRTISVAVAAFVLGFIVQFVASAITALSTSQNPEIARHWKLVNDYNAYMRDPDNYSADPSGLYGADVPYDPEPSLMALVTAGELEYVDIVLPLVPANRETDRYWMQFVRKRQETMLYATGNPDYVDYKPSGESPLHLQLWFKKSAKADVQRLIRELETLAAEDGYQGSGLFDE